MPKILTENKWIICSWVHRGLGKYFCGSTILDKYLWIHYGLGYYFCMPNSVENWNFWTEKWHCAYNFRNTLTIYWLGKFDFFFVRVFEDIGPHIPLFNCSFPPFHHLLYFFTRSPLCSVPLSVSLFSLSLCPTLSPRTGGEQRYEFILFVILAVPNRCIFVCRCCYSHQSVLLCRVFILLKKIILLVK